jgi:hypothetical protein
MFLTSAKKHYSVHILVKDNYKYLEFDHDVFFINDMSGAPCSRVVVHG